MVTVRANKLDSLGIGIDFKILKKHVKEVVDRLDHRDLNTFEPFLTINPSSENIARYIYDNLKEILHSENYFLYSVGISETESSSLVYYGDQNPAHF